MTVSAGVSISSVRGTVTTWSASPSSSPFPSVVIAITRPPRAFTSSMFDTIFG